MNSPTAPEAVFIGVISYDTIASVAHYPSADERVAADTIIAACGGPASTAAVACARQGHKVAVCGVVGDDGQATAVCDRLVDEGIDISGIVRRPGAATSQSVIVVDSKRGTRAISNRPGPDFRPSRDIIDTLAEPRWVHVDHHGYAALAALRDVWPEACLSMDEGHCIGFFDPAAVDIYIPTHDVLKKRFGEADLDESLRRAHAAGIREVVATAGAHGSAGIDEQGGLYRIAAYDAPDIVSTLGAGDVFHGGLVAARLQGRRADDALAYASVTAAMSCRGLDGQSAIPGRAEVEVRLKRWIA